MRHKEKSSGHSGASGILLAEVSHDIRNLLNSIIGYSELIRNDADLTPVIKGYANTINNGGKDLLNILDKIIQISRIQAGKEKLNNSSFDLGALTDDIKITAATLGIRLRIEFLRDAERSLIGDAGKIGQLLTGLLLGMAADSRIQDMVVTIGTQPRGKSEIITGTVTPGKKMRECRPAGSPDGFSEGRRAMPHAGIHLALSHEIAHLMGGKITVQTSRDYQFEIEVKKGALKPDSSAAFNHPGHGRDGARSAVPDLSGIPGDILKEMQTAAKNARLDLLSDLAKQVENHNPGLAKFLDSAIKSYDYEVIFAILHLNLKT